MAWDTAISSVLGGSIATILIRFFIANILRDLNSALQQINELSKKLTEITVKLESVEKDALMLHEHDRKIAALEATVYGNRK